MGGDMTEMRHARSDHDRQERTFLLICAVQALAAAVFSLLVWAVLSAVFPSLRHAPDSPRLTGDDFGIPAYVSDEDADGDGIDDQSDILQSAKDYVATGPRYATTYFQGGWPTDGTGACTDVVAYALLGAGYDLQEMVDADMREDPSEYGLDPDAPDTDPNIDYRRVRNLKVFFCRHAQILTTDVSDAAAWQGGDIVCYADHIAVVSDRRNPDGTPYILHNGSPWQRSYEEDRLGDWGGPEHHWRWR